MFEIKLTKKHAEYVIYTIAIIAILAIAAFPNQGISGQAIDHSVIEIESTSTPLTVEVKNTDDFTWNNVRIILEDTDGIEYECPKMLYLKSGSSVIMKTSYCFNKANIQMRKEPAKLKLVTDEGTASFVY